MHKEAEKRMRQLVREWLDEIVLDGKAVDSQSLSNPKLAPLVDLVEKKCGEWVAADPDVRMQVQISGYRAVLAANLSGHQGMLKDCVDEETRNHLAAEITDWWASIPRRYAISFLLPNISWPIEDPIKIGENVHLIGVADSSRTARAFSGLLGLAGAEDQIKERVCALRIESEGQIFLRAPTDSAVADAVRTAKQVIELAATQNLLHSWFSKGDITPAAEAIDLVSNKEVGPVALSAGFASRLSVLRLLNPLHKINSDDSALALASEEQRRQSLIDSFRSIGRIVEQARREEPSKADMTKKPALSVEAHVITHCSRVVTAAEWLFDSHEDPNSAMSYMQTAIALEALFSADSEEGINSTMRNRIAFSLGTNSVERVRLADEFGEFYKKRSAIVHKGASKLSAGEAKILARGRATLERALMREMQIVGPFPGDEERRDRTKLLAALRNSTQYP